MSFIKMNSLVILFCLFVCFFFFFGGGGGVKISSYIKNGTKTLQYYFKVHVTVYQVENANVSTS